MSNKIPPRTVEVREINRGHYPRKLPNKRWAVVREGANFITLQPGVFTETASTPIGDPIKFNKKTGEVSPRPRLGFTKWLLAELQLEGYERIVMAMCKDCTDPRGVFVANPEDKRAAYGLEHKALVTIERTAEKFAGLDVWYVKRVA
jgi:hypothetical protein